MRNQVPDMLSMVLLDLILLGLIFRDCLANLILVWLLGCLPSCLRGANLRGESRRGRPLFPVSTGETREGENRRGRDSDMFGYARCIISYSVLLQDAAT